MSTNNFGLYEIYASRREELILLCERQRRVIEGLDLDRYTKENPKPSEVLANLATRLREENLRVLVMGEFSSGKSTFINALLGEKILPAKALPTTAVISEVRFADEAGKRVIMFPRPGKWPNGDSPFQIGIKELEKYTTIEHTVEDGKTNRSPFRKAEVYWPLALCRNGVELVDSPGLNDPDSHDEITLHYTTEADAIVYCVSGIHACTRLDMDTIEMLRNMGYKTILFVATYYDRIRESAMMNGSREDEEFRRVIIGRLAPNTELGRQGIFFVDSRDGLEGKIATNQELLEDSGIPLVEEQLEVFLVRQRGQAKLNKALHVIKDMNAKAAREIENLQSLSRVSLEDLERRFEDAKRPLEELRMRGDLILGKVKLGIQGLFTEIERVSRLFLVGCPDKVGDWLEHFELKNKISKNPFKMKESVEIVADEYLEQVKIKMNLAAGAWASTTLNPLIQSTVQQIFRDLDQKTKEYETRLNEIRLSLQFDPRSTGASIAEEQEPSAMSRLGGIAYGILTQDWINAGMTSVFGLKGLLRSLALQVVAGVVLGVASLFTPVGLPAFVIGVVLAACAGAGWNFMSISGTIRQKVIEACQTALRDPAQQTKMAQDTVSAAREELQKIVDAVGGAIQGDLAQLQGQVQTVINEKKAGEEQIARRRAVLDALRQENEAIVASYSEIAMEAGA